MINNSKLVGKASLAIPLLLLVGAANAAVVSVDYQVAGDGLITRDLDNAMEWLDVSETVGVTANQAAALYGADGFRFATAAEVVTLFISAGIDEILDFSTFPPTTVHGTYDYNVTQSPQNVTSEAGKAAVANLMDLLGYSDEAFNGLDQLSGHLADEDSDGFRDIARLQAATDFRDAFAHTNAGGDFFDPAIPSDFQGYWLVRDAAVIPIPAAAWLFGSGVVCLIGAARRKKLQ